MNARHEILLPYGTQELAAYVPDANLEGIFVPQAVEACSDPVDEIRRALAQPLDTPPLSDLVQPGERVVVLVDDHTRTTPAAPCSSSLGRRGTMVHLVVVHARACPRRAGTPPTGGDVDRQVHKLSHRRIEP